MVTTSLTERLGYTEKEFRAMFPYSRSAFWVGVREGRIPVIRIGRRVYVKRSYVDRLRAEIESDRIVYDHPRHVEPL